MRTANSRKTEQQFVTAARVSLVLITVSNSMLLVAVSNANEPVLPARFPNQGDSLDDVAQSQLAQLVGSGRGYMEQLYTFSDIDRDPRFADNEAIKRWGVRFYAGYPLRSKEGFVFGAFCILDDEPRNFEEKDVQLLEKMAAEVGAAITDDEIQAQSTNAAAVPASATVGQQVPD